MENRFSNVMNFEFGSISNPIYIEDQKTFDNVNANLPAGCFIQFNCLKCGKTNIVQFKHCRKESLRKMLCRSCKMSDIVSDDVDRRKAWENTQIEKYGSLWSKSENGKSFLKESAEARFDKAKQTQRKNNNGLLWCQTDEARNFMSKQNELHPEWHEKAILTKLSNPTSNGFIYFGIVFDSIAELAFYIYLKFVGMNVVRLHGEIRYKYTNPINNKDRYVYPDFIVNGTVVEIKGGMYFNDSGETMIYPYKIERGVRLSDKELLVRNVEYDLKYKTLLKNNVVVIRDDSEYIINCKNFVKTFIFSNNKYWYDMFRVNKLYNVSYGYNQFNYRANEEFQNPINIGYTPFNT